LAQPITCGVYNEIGLSRSFSPFTRLQNI